MFAQHQALFLTLPPSEQAGGCERGWEGTGMRPELIDIVHLMSSNVMLINKEGKEEI